MARHQIGRPRLSRGTGPQTQNCRQPRLAGAPGGSDRGWWLYACC
jgi:hypothetical protein